MKQKVLAQSLDYAHLAVEAASDKQAADILMLDIRSICDFADYFVVLTAESSRQMQAIAEAIEFSVERSGGKLHHREGDHQSGWLLLDFGDVIVHLFGPEERSFYDIESAWFQAVEVVRIL